jgi:hypothetical protein
LIAFEGFAEGIGELRGGCGGSAGGAEGFRVEVDEVLDGIGGGETRAFGCRADRFEESGRFRGGRDLGHEHDGFGARGFGDADESRAEGAWP